MKWKRAKLQVTSATGAESRPATASFPAFAPIVSDAFEHLKNLPEPTEMLSGAFLVEQDARVGWVYLLRRGLVKLIYVTPEGRETTLGLRTSGWYAGGVSALMDAPSVYSVKAVTPCVVSRIPAVEFQNRLMQSARMTRHFVDTLCHELTSQAAAQAQMMGGSAQDRLAHFMRERNSEHPQLKTLDALPLLKQMELAQLLSITPEHLSRLLQKIQSTEEEGVRQRSELPHPSKVY
jgi:CRP/FNR family transcriptional regulator